jgi:hypothetical protein
MGYHQVSLKETQQPSWNKIMKFRRIPHSLARNPMDLDIERIEITATCMRLDQAFMRLDDFPVDNQRNPDRANAAACGISGFNVNACDSHLISYSFYC